MRKFGLRPKAAPNTTATPFSSSSAVLNASSLSISVPPAEVLPSSPSIEG